jgi:hypothetical protein
MNRDRPLHLINCQVLASPLTAINHKKAFDEKASILLSLSPLCSQTPKAKHHKRKETNQEEISSIEAVFLSRDGEP